jgi:hypothetical protein
MKSGSRREFERGILNSVGILTFDINLGRAAFGEILMLTLGGGGKFTLGQNFYINIGRAASKFVEVIFKN